MTPGQQTRLITDTFCQFGTVGCPVLRRLDGDAGMGTTQLVLSGFDDRFIYKQDRNVIAHGVDAMAAGAFQARSIVFLYQGLATCRANDNVQKILRNHGRHCTPQFPQLTPCVGRFTFALISDTGSRVVFTFRKRLGSGCKSRAVAQL